MTLLIRIVDLKHNFPRKIICIFDATRRFRSESERWRTFRHIYIRDVIFKIWFFQSAIICVHIWQRHDSINSAHETERMVQVEAKRGTAREAHLHVTDRHVARTLAYVYARAFPTLDSNCLACHGEACSLYGVKGRAFFSVRHPLIS